MAKRLSVPSKFVQLVIVGPKGAYKVPRVQRLSLNSDIPSTTIDQIGSSTHAGEAKDAPNVTLTFSAFNVGPKTFAALTGTDYASYPAGGVDISKLTDVDAILYTRSDSTSDYVRSIHAKRLKIRDCSFNFSVDGEATEDYTAVGAEKRVFAHDIVVDRLVTGTTSFTVTQTPIQLKNGNNALSVILDGGYLTEVSGTPATGQYKLTGTTLTTFDTRTSEVVVVYHADPTGSNWADVSESTFPAAVRGRDVLVKLSANSMQRVQSIAINVNLNSTAVKELGNRETVGYQNQVATVEGTLTVLDTDTELVNLFTNGVPTTSGVVEWSFGEGCVTSGISLSIQLVDPCDVSSPYTVVEEIYLDNITPVGDATSVNVNGDSQLQINWKSQTAGMVFYNGAKP